MGRLHRIAILAVALAATMTAVRAEDFPSRPVRVIVGFTPGASADITARIVANRMSQILNQQFVVENKPGAGSSLAADFVAHAPKDGYTLLIGTSANLTNAVISPNLGFDFVKDFAPIALATRAPIILAVHPSLGVNSVQELIALAKAKPGEILYASTGVGAAPHLSGELFNARAGIKTVHVPYQGSPQAVTDLIAGRTSMMFSPASAVMPHIESGALKASRVGGEQAAERRTRPADHGRGRHTRFRYQHLVRVDGPARHTARGHRQARRAPSTKRSNRTRSWPA